MAVPSTFCIILILSFAIMNVKSSDYFFDFPNFAFPTFTKRALGHVFLANDASIANEVLELTKKDQDGHPLRASVGQARLHRPICIYDNTTGKVTDFTTEFSFVVSRNGMENFGDGMAFFLAPPHFKFPNRTKSSGGFLGMFTNDDDNNNNGRDKIVLVEFDSFENRWDPYYMNEFSHLGINVGSIRSRVTDFWDIDSEADGTKGTVQIHYNSKQKQLGVLVGYPYESPTSHSSLVLDIDLATVLPECVLIGFSASTGDYFETHDIFSWSFSSSLL